MAKTSVMLTMQNDGSYLYVSPCLATGDAKLVQGKSRCEGPPGGLPLVCASIYVVPFSQVQEEILGENKCYQYITKNNKWSVASL